MLYCTATAISEPVFVPCEPGEEHPKRSKPWLVIWPASSTECSRAGRHLSTAAYRNMKTGARNVNSRFTVQSRGSRIQACQRSEPCVTPFLSRNFQRTQGSSWRAHAGTSAGPVSLELFSSRTALRDWVADRLRHLWSIDQ